MLETVPYRLPLVRPLRLPGGITLTCREGVLIHDPETGGRGDAAPLPGFSTETIEDVMAAAREGGADSGLPSLEFALECAEHVFAPPSEPVRVNALWFADRESPGDLARRLRDWPRPVVKLKPGPDPDPSRWRELRRLLPEATFRIDPNRGWGVGQTLRILDQLPEEAVEYVEEPLADPAGYGDLWRRRPVPVALDESLREAGGEALARHPHVKALVVKPTLMGRGVSRWRSVARDSGRELIWSGCFESGVGLWNLARLAQGRGAAGLDTGAVLAEDLVSPRPLPCRGFIASDRILRVTAS